MEVYVLVEKKKNMLLQIATVTMIVAGCITLLLTVLGGYIFIPVVALEFLAAYFLSTRNYEYEYSYFDGEARFAKIINKSKRKNLKGYTMDEVIVIAPIDNRAVYQYLNDSNTKKKDYTSGIADARVYALVVKTPDGIEVVKYEPDEKYLDAICIKYRQKVIK